MVESIFEIDICLHGILQNLTTKELCRASIVNKHFYRASFNPQLGGNILRREKFWVTFKNEDFHFQKMKMVGSSFYEIALGDVPLKRLSLFLRQVDTLEIKDVNTPMFPHKLPNLWQLWIKDLENEPYPIRSEVNEIIQILNLFNTSVQITNTFFKVHTLEIGKLEDLPLSLDSYPDLEFIYIRSSLDSLELMQNYTDVDFCFILRSDMWDDLANLTFPSLPMIDSIMIDLDWVYLHDTEKCKPDFISDFLLNFPNLREVYIEKREYPLFDQINFPSYIAVFD